MEYLLYTWDFPDSSVGKESVCNAGDPGLIPGLGRSAGERMGSLSAQSCLTLWTPWTIQDTEFSKPEYRSEKSFPSAGDLPNPGIEPRSPALQADS